MCLTNGVNTFTNRNNLSWHKIEGYHKSVQFYISKSLARTYYSQVPVLKMSLLKRLLESLAIGLGFSVDLSAFSGCLPLNKQTHHMNQK